MASSGSRTPGAVYDSGDIELRFGNKQKSLWAHSQFLSLASPTVLGPMINAEERNKASYLRHAAGLVESAVAWGQGQGQGQDPSQSLTYGRTYTHGYGQGQQVQVQDKGSKPLKHSVGEWLWLLDELQLVGMHDAFQKLIKGLPKRRLCDIAQEVTADAAPSKRISTVGMVMAEFDPKHITGNYPY
eukprot:gene19035-25630_t